MAAAAPARTGRHTEPRWARQFPATPEGMDAQQVHAAARRLPADTDPDTIDDPEIREAFLSRLQAAEDDAGGDRSAGHADRASTGRGRTSANSPGGRGRAARRRGGFTPTLRPPSRLSAADGSGFMLGLVLYAIGLNYLRFGWPGVTQWLKAKFTNSVDLTPDQLLLFSPLDPNLARRLSREARAGHGPDWYTPPATPGPGVYGIPGLPGAPMGPTTGGTTR